MQVIPLLHWRSNCIQKILQTAFFIIANKGIILTHMLTSSSSQTGQTEMFEVQALRNHVLFLNISPVAMGAREVAMHNVSCVAIALDFLLDVVA